MNARPGLVVVSEPTCAPAAASERSVIVVSALCMGVGASLGFMPGFIATALGEDLGISRGQIGLLVSLYFGCTGAGSMLGGRLTERLGARLVVTIDMVAVAAAAIFTALVGSYWALLVASVVGGTGYSLVNAGTNVAIGRAVPDHRRTLAMSIKTAGVPLMAFVGAALGPWTAQRWGWEVIAAVVAIAAGIAATAALATLDDDRPERSRVRVEGSLPPDFAWFAVGAFLLIAGSQPLYSWTVAYLEQSLDASAGVAGAISAVASAIGVCLMIVNAMRADRLGADLRARRIVVLVCVNLFATLLVLSGARWGIGVAAVGVVIGISAQLSAIGTMHAAVVDRAPQCVARATGVTMTGYYLGALLSPAAFGVLVDATDTFAWSWIATSGLLLLAIPAWVRAGRVGRPSGPAPGVASTDEEEGAP